MEAFFLTVVFPPNQKLIDTTSVVRLHVRRHRTEQIFTIAFVGVPIGQVQLVVPQYPTLFFTVTCPEIHPFDPLSQSLPSLRL